MYRAKEYGRNTYMLYTKNDVYAGRGTYGTGNQPEECPEKIRSFEYITSPRLIFQPAWFQEQSACALAAFGI